jgi:indoleamine 2,3-dioxygenase
MKCQSLFTRLKDEEEFYLVSIAVEIRAIEMVKLMRDVVNLVATGREAVQLVAQHLSRIRIIVDELSTIVQGVRANCRPHTFYHAIRPWFRGSDAEGENSPGWIYQGVARRDCANLSGPSAGQSTSMHALDCFLSIDHELVEERMPVPSANNRSADTGFMERMRLYMPGPHREFLQYLKGRSVRRVAQSTPSLTPYYDEVVLAMKRFRDTHMRIAVLYIISMARANAHARRKDDDHDEAPVRGTGGTELAKLLKAGRDATIRSIISPRG